MSESLRPQVTDFKDNADAAKLEASKPLTVETYANGNPVAREMHPNNELFGEKAARMIGETGAKIDALRTKTTDFIGSTAQRGGASFSTWASQWSEATKIANERKLSKLDLNLPSEPAIAGQETPTTNQEAVVTKEKEAVAKSEDESKIAVAQADEQVGALTSNFTLESVAGSRAAIKNAAEKTIDAGAKKLSFSERLVAVFRNLFGIKKRNEQLKAMKKTATDPNPEIAAPAQALAAVTEQRMEVTDSLHDVMSAGEDGGEVSTPLDTLAEDPAKQVAEAVAAPVIDAGIEAAGIPVLKDIGIENAFRVGAGVMPIIEDSGIEDAFRAGRAENVPTVAAAPAAPIAPEPPVLDEEATKRIAAEVAWPPPIAANDAVPMQAANDNEVPTAANDSASLAEGEIKKVA